MEENIKLIASNKKAHYEYFLSDFLECGLELKGTEIKSLRINGGSLNESYVIIKNGQAFILGMNIPQYEQGNIFNHEHMRTRKLLLHKQEINKLHRKVQEKGFTLSPLDFYLKNGRVKVKLGVCKGKKQFDKRADIKERDVKRDLQREFRKKLDN